MPDEDIPSETHRSIGALTNRRAWELLGNDARSPDDEREMVHAAHASAWHWMQGGEAINVQRAEWLVSHVYAVVARPEPALVHARRCLEITERENLTGFDLAYAYEAMARANAIGGDASADEWRDRAGAAGSEIDDAEDRALFAADLGADPWEPAARI